VRNVLYCPDNVLQKSSEKTAAAEKSRNCKKLLLHSNAYKQMASRYGRA